MQRSRKTKIIATLGPASSDYEVIRKLFEQGADVFRLNFSHGSYEEHKKRYEIIRALEQEKNHSIGIIVDLQGPKLRLGRFSSSQVFLQSGDSFRFDNDERDGDESRVYFPHADVLAACEVGQDILLDDGKLRLCVRDKGKDYVDTDVLIGGALSSNKGVSFVGSSVLRSALTEKDQATFLLL